MIGELTDKESLKFLANCRFGSLGCTADDDIYVVPISFAIDGDRLIGQTKLGRKIEMMRQNSWVCVESHEVKSISNWKSVIAWGRFEELTGSAANDAMARLIDHFSPMMEKRGSNRSPREITPRLPDGSPQVDLVYCIHLDLITGRYEVPD